MTNFSRAPLTAHDVDDDREIVAVPAAVVETKALLCAARLENGIDHADFKQLVDDFEESVRHDERERAKIVAAIARNTLEPIAAPSIRTKLMDVAGEAEIRKRLEAAPRTDTGKLRQGWAATIGAELGYTIQQVQSVIYKLKHGRGRK